MLSLLFNLGMWHPLFTCILLHLALLNSWGVIQVLFYRRNRAAIQSGQAGKRVSRHQEKSNRNLCVWGSNSWIIGIDQHLFFLSFLPQYFLQTGFSWCWIKLTCCLRSRGRSWTESWDRSLDSLLFVWSLVTLMKDCRTSSQCCTAVSRICELLPLIMFCSANY